MGVTTALRTDDPVWYVAYASNLSARRLQCYLQGGRPAGARRTYEGCRDPSPPARVRSVALDGALAFSGRSSVWGGAMAFHDLEADGVIAARSYQLTFGQLSDLVSQETRQPVGRDLPFVKPDDGLWPTTSPVYELLAALGHHGGIPMYCLTSRRVLEPAAPSAAYLLTILTGLREAFGWTPRESAHYLLQAKGVSPAWSESQLRTLGDGPGSDRR
jgi:hypothetical protein